MRPSGQRDHRETDRLPDRSAAECDRAREREAGLSARVRAAGRSLPPTPRPSERFKGQPDLQAVGQLSTRLAVRVVRLAQWLDRPGSAPASVMPFGAVEEEAEGEDEEDEDEMMGTEQLCAMEFEEPEQWQSGERRPGGGVHISPRAVLVRPRPRTAPGPRRELFSRTAAGGARAHNMDYNQTQWP